MFISTSLVNSHNMWSSENDVILSAASYYMDCKVNNKIKSVRKPTSFESFDDLDEPPLFQLAKGDAYSKQCGKIFITINQLLIFHCAFCSNRYGTLFDFMQHISAMHLQKKTITKIINAAELSDGEETPIIEYVPVPKYLSLGVGNKAIADNIPSSFKKTTKKPIVDEPSSSKTKEKPVCKKQNKTTKKDGKIEAVAVNVEETTEMEPADIESERDNQDEASISSSLEDLLEPIMDSQSSCKPLAHKCDKCDKAFVKKTSLKIHIQSHSNVKNFKCTLCEKTFKYQSSLRLHFLRHTTEKKYSCDFCDKRFALRSEVTVHRRMHTGERPYVCFKCGKAFKNSAHFNTHIKTIHLNIREKKCDICSKAFFSNYQLRNHMAGHSNQRPFACTQCSASFARKKTLTQHIKLHTNARQYKCTICDKSFNQSPALISHMNINHKNLQIKV